MWPWSEIKRLKAELHYCRYEMTDAQLPVTRRTYAAHMEAQWLRKVHETTRMHKAIRKLHRRIVNLQKQLAGK